MEIVKTIFSIFLSIVLFSFLSCSDDNSEDEPGPIVSGNWTTTTDTGFGTLDFIVNSEGTHINEFDLTMYWTIGNISFDGSHLISRYTNGMPIVDRQFSFTYDMEVGFPPYSSSTLTLTINGTFSVNGKTAEGDWNASKSEPNGGTDSGNWTASPSEN